jgi:DNA-binding transcriptional LysR family regulator
MSIPDLNLLRIFDALLEERSVTRAGTRLGLSQSAVSHALARLRHMLGDQLFVRGPSGIRPTPRALEIGARIHGPITQLQAALGPGGFDPATSRRRFTLVAGAYAATVLGAPLVKRQAEVAPGAELAMIPFGPDLLDRLDRREADAAVAAIISAPERFALQPLVREELTWAVGLGSPLARAEAVDLADIAATPHVVIDGGANAAADIIGRGLVVRSSWEDAGALELALASAGLSRRIAVTVPDSTAALAVVAQSDYATLVPRRLAARWAAAGWLRLIEPPYPSPPVELNLLYRRDTGGEGPTAWFRNLIVSVAATL